MMVYGSSVQGGAVSESSALRIVEPAMVHVHVFSGMGAGFDTMPGDSRRWVSSSQLEAVPLR